MINPFQSLDFANFAEKTTMSISKLKRALIQRITEIEDKSFLEAIKTILDAKASSVSIDLPPDIVSEIEASKREIEQGLHTDNDLLEKEINQWLDQK